MKFLDVLAVLAAVVITTAIADFTQYAEDLPNCGLLCILDVIPKSGCSLSDEVCICTSKELEITTQDCLIQKCTVVESLQVLKISNLSCGKPIQSRSNHIVASSAMAGVTFAAILLRLISKCGSYSYKAEDYLMFVIFLLLIPFTTFGMMAPGYGFGKNMWDIPTQNLITALKIFFWSQPIYVVVLGLSKISMILFYLRIFPSQNFKRPAIACLYWVAVTAILFVFLTVFQCWPLDFNWEGWKGDFGPHACRDVFIQANAHAIINITQDFAVLVLPLPWLFKLQIGVKKKINVVLLFSLGIFICITSILRLVNLSKFKKTVNPTWDYTDAIFWSGVETYMSVLIPNLPAIRALLSRKYPKIFGTETVTSNYQRQYEQSQPSRHNQSYRMHSRNSNTDIEDRGYFQNGRLDLSHGERGKVMTDVTAGSVSGEAYVRKEHVIVTTETIVEGRVLTPTSERSSPTEGAEWYSVSPAAGSKENIVEGKAL